MKHFFAPLTNKRSIIFSSPMLVALTALVGYLLIFLLFLSRFGDLRDFIVIGKEFITQSNQSSVIKFDSNYAYLEDVPGYDGQFAYFIALDPPNARYYVDQNRVTYRYTRILYPLLVKAFAFGNPDWVPLTLVLVNLLSITVGTYAIALWCQKSKLTPWLGLIFAFYIGQILTFVRDLNEIVAYSLVAIAVYLFDYKSHKPLLSATFFGLSALARETTLLFCVVYAIAFAARIVKEKQNQSQLQSMLKIAAFGGLAFGPAILWQLFLFWWLGSIGWLQGSSFVLLPFVNLYQLYPAGEGTLNVIESVVIPCTICLLICCLHILTNLRLRWSKAHWLCILNALFFVLLINPDSLFELYAASRVATPVVVAALYCLPSSHNKNWFYICTGFWLAPTFTYLFNPSIGAITDLLSK